MRIKKLEMKNFRGFEELTIEFPEKGSAVFVGVNGAGKTSVLLCTTIMLKGMFLNMIDFKHDPFFSKNDVKLKEDNTTNKLIINFEENIHTIKTKFDFYDELVVERRPDSNIFDLIRKDILSDDKKNIPFFVFYPTNRNIEKNVSLKLKNVSNKSQLDSIYIPYNISFTKFFEWFRNMEDIENEEIRFNNNINFRNKGLETVRNAITLMLPKFSNPRVQRQPQEELIIEKDGEKLSISNLSHGEKAMFGMVGDIARRLSIANPSLENPLEGEGIILIDEIELHLHPGWQRTIVPRLEKTFPNIQFILTTHSPQVLSTMKKENVFILEDFKLVQNTPHTFGKDSNSILYDLFAVSERPDEAKKDFKKLYQLIDDEAKVKEAKIEYEKMKEKYGDFDPEILKAGIHLDFLIE
ncbi:MAG: AAA family ATPase [Saprospiraceae bacterium]